MSEYAQLIWFRIQSTIAATVRGLWKKVKFEAKNTPPTLSKEER
jgi:hypothetical protein